MTTPAEFAARIRSDHEKYGKIIKDIGVKVNRTAGVVDGSDRRAELVGVDASAP